jgi:aryl-alcohol dehydrogenase-like predicted oxidoreductase
MTNPAGRRRIGRTAIEVSQLGFGAAPFGNLLADVPDSATHISIRRRSTDTACRSIGWARL